MKPRDRQQGSAANTTDSMTVYTGDGEVKFKGPMSLTDDPARLPAGTNVYAAPPADDGEVLGVATGEDYDPDGDDDE